MARPALKSPSQLPNIAPLREANDSKTSLISPSADIFAVGGGSILFFFLAFCLIDRSVSTAQVAIAAFYLGFVVNWPHFMLSYQLLYFDRRHKLLSNWQHIWAAFVSPTLLIAAIVYGCAFQSAPMLAFLVQAMFFLVGWHYVKQVYGTMIVTSAIRKVYFGAREKFCLRLHLYGIWFASFVAGTSGMRDFDFYGVKYHSLNIPDWVLSADYYFTAAMLVLTAGFFAARYIRDGVKPPLLSFLPLIALYCWYLPSLYHPVFYFMVPFFHSLQYLPFVLAFKKRQVTEKSGDLGTADGRFKLVRSYTLYFASAIVLGFVSFLTLPSMLNGRIVYDTRILGPQIFTYAFYLFINVHHYFIDNVIWKGTDPEVRRYLMGRG